MASKLQGCHSHHRCATFTTVVMLALLAVAILLPTGVDAAIATRHNLDNRDELIAAAHPPLLRTDLVRDFNQLSAMKVLTLCLPQFNSNPIEQCFAEL